MNNHIHAVIINGEFYDPIVFLVDLLWVALIIYLVNKYRKYKNSTYCKDTGYAYREVKFNKGRLGEYLIFARLQELEKYGVKFLFNAYIPKENGTTTEIDVLAISHNGITVFESKNYSGWIFGTETQRIWTQVLPTGRGKSQKTQFLNPIMQNKVHIKYLQNIVGTDININSIIVFSERCTFKDLKLTSGKVKVIKRNEILKEMQSYLRISMPYRLSSERIISIYNRLYPYTKVDEVKKQEHVHNIKSDVSGKNRRKSSYSEMNSYQFKSNTSKIKREAPHNVNSELKTPKKCPRCGNNLVLRVAKKGNYVGKQFYGCSSFPKCRYTENMIR